MIFLVKDPINNASTFFVPDEATVADGQSLIEDGGNISIVVGTQEQANALLATNRTSFLAENEHRIVVHEETVINDRGDTSWTPVDVNSAPEGKFKIYDGVNGAPVNANTLAEAKTAYNEAKETLISWAGLSSVIQMSEFPNAHKRRG